jgi:hypothetical protein
MGVRILTRSSEILGDPVAGWTEAVGSWEGEFYPDDNTLWSCESGTNLPPDRAILSAGTSYLPGTTPAELTKDFDVSDLATDIDAGNITVDFSADVATYTGYTYDLLGRVSLEFYDSGDSIIGSRVSTGWVSDPGCTWTGVTPISQLVPANTRTIRAIFEGSHNYSPNTTSRSVFVYFSSALLTVSGTAITDSSNIRVTQAGLEVLATAGDVGEVRVTQAGLEVLAMLPPWGRNYFHNFQTEKTKTGWTITGADAADIDVLDGVVYDPATNDPKAYPVGLDACLRFDAGPNTAQTTVHKDFDLSSAADFIDAGFAYVAFEAYQCSQDATQDQGRISIEFYNGSDVIIGSRISTDWAATDEFTVVGIPSTAVPINTRKVRLLYEGNWLSGSYLNVAYAGGAAWIEGYGIEAEGGIEVYAIDPSALVTREVGLANIMALDPMVLVYYPRGGRKPMICGVIT